MTVECAHLRDWILRWLVQNGATPEWQAAAHLEIEKRGLVNDDNTGPRPVAAVRRRH